MAYLSPTTCSNPPAPLMRMEGKPLETRALAIAISADEQLRGPPVVPSFFCRLSRPPGVQTLTQFHKQLVNRLNDVGLELGIRRAEILA